MILLPFALIRVNQSKIPSSAHCYAWSHRRNWETSVEYVTPPKSVSIQSSIPFASGNRIKSNIKTECSIDTQLAQFIDQYGDENGVDVQLKQTVSKSDSGPVLIVEITDAVSQGNAFLGHRKYTAIQGTLHDNGVEIASFSGGRNSGGGAFAGFKGSCSVLGRTVDTLGSDVAMWLKKPYKNATLGDM